MSELYNTYIDRDRTEFFEVAVRHLLESASGFTTSVTHNHNVAGIADGFKLTAAHFIDDGAQYHVIYEANTFGSRQKTQRTEIGLITPLSTPIQPQSRLYRYQPGQDELEITNTPGELGSDSTTLWLPNITDRKGTTRDPARLAQEIDMISDIAKINSLEPIKTFSIARQVMRVPLFA